MSTSAYHERIWESIPEGLEPWHLRPRLEFLLDRVPTGARILDVGCGEGRFTAELTRAGRDAVGIEVAAEPLRRARVREPRLDLRLVAAEAPLPFPDASFDAVWAGEVIARVADTAGWLSEVRRVLRSGGVLALSTPNHAPLTRLRLGLSRSAFEQRFDPRRDELRFYTRATLARLLHELGFEAIELRAVGGPPRARAVLLAGARRARY